VNPDPKFDPELLRDAGILSGDTALDLHCASCGVDGAGELHQHAITGSLDDTAAMRGDCGVDKRLSERLQIGERAFLVATHQATIGGNVRRQHSCQSPFHALTGQKTL
jgi:hypothetical protein